MTDEEANEICNKCAETTYDRGYRSGFNRGVELQNAKLKKAVKKIKEEIKDMSFEYQLVKRTEFVGYAEWKEEAISLDNALEIIDKHTEGLI